MDPGRTAKALDYGRGRGGSGIIVRWGRRVGSWGNQRAKYDLKSSTKSFGSILAALAFKDGRLDRETLIEPILPEIVQSQTTGQQRAWAKQIQVKHLLTHTAGFGKVGGVTPLGFAPGTAWRYSDGGPNWLADTLTVLYGKDLLGVLQRRVLAPMGIPNDRLQWRQNQYRSHLLRGIERREFGSGISTDVDVMARIGLMLLRDGLWKDTRILLADDVNRATSHRPWLSDLRCIDDIACGSYPGNHGYGFLFWSNEASEFLGVGRKAFYAYGLYDSFILVMPSLGIVTARAGPSYSDSIGTYFALVARYAN
jgi:CubicO group peptidase (beta-lactamase class C family)